MRRPADVRMFPGWAESVLWVHGPVSYVELGLPAALVEDLEAWELRWCRAVDPGAPPRSRRQRARHNREGRRLARRLSQALGWDFVVELHLDRWLLSRRRYRGSAAGSVPSAAAAIRTVQAADARESAELAAFAADRVEFEWRAYDDR